MLFYPSLAKKLGTAGRFHAKLPAMEHLTREQLLTLLAVAKARSERDWLMILIGYCHGLRASEVCGLTGRHIRDGFMTVQRLKGSLRTTQPLVESDDPVLNERAGLTSWLAAHPKGRLFDIKRVQFFNVFRAHCRAAGIPAHLSHPHVLKHSCGMQNIRTAGIENVRQYLGHRSLASTGAYLKVSDAEASAAMRF